jgi:transcriptional regulator with GAF, ATPase, and Fis domain
VSQNIEPIRHYKGELFQAGLERIPDENTMIERSLDAQATLHDGIDSLNRLVNQLAAAVDTIEQPTVPSIENGLDFYSEVRKFEVSLIQRAMKVTGGVQKRAARLLNLKHTTLNAKIKNYGLG